MAYPRIAVIHHLQQPFLGHAAAPLGAVEEHFGGALVDLDAVDGIVSLGGEQSAWDPVLEPEVELIREAVARELPFLGVCLGAQLLAHAHGGEVARLPRRLVTWAPIQVLADDPVLGAIPAGAHALHWNEDGFELPPGATEILRRPRGGRAEGFRLGRLAWGVQFHPEVDATALDGWYRAWGDVLAPAGVTEAGARLADARHLPAQAALSTAIFGAFARLVRSRTPSRPPRSAQA
jgi:GMP synthase (glutamine-hydrolysing)